MTVMGILYGCLAFLAGVAVGAVLMVVLTVEDEPPQRPRFGAPD